jgi:UTP--glucose-1-phosphate uridylyltransferase
LVDRVGCLSQMTAAYNEAGGCVVAVREVPLEETRRYGVITPAGERGGMIAMTGVVEKPEPSKAPSRLAVIGRYILQPEVFAELERHELGAGDEIQLTDAMARLIGRMPFHGYRYTGQRYDCGDKVGFLHANIAVGLGRPDISGALTEIIKSLKL